MIGYAQIFEAVEGLDEAQLSRWISRGWVRPEGSGEATAFADADVAVRTVAEQLDRGGAVNGAFDLHALGGVDFKRRAIAGADGAASDANSVSMAARALASCSVLARRVASKVVTPRRSGRSTARIIPTPF